jgi:curved DNA-binding protein CbpA
MPKHIQNHYEFLGVSPQATIEEIKAQRNRMLQAYHPDHNKNSSANAITRSINEAWETLSDPVRRREYDETLKSKPSATSYQESKPSATSYQESSEVHRPRRPSQRYRKPTKVHSRKRHRQPSRKASHIDYDYVTEPVANAQDYRGSSLQKSRHWETAKKVLKWTVIVVFYVVVIFIALVAASSKKGGRRRY